MALIMPHDLRLTPQLAQSDNQKKLMILFFVVISLCIIYFITKIPNAQMLNFRDMLKHPSKTEFFSKLDRKIKTVL